MIIKFLNDLANKPYEVRYRIFWFIMIAVAIAVVAGWLFLIKNYQFSKVANDSNFKMPSFNEIVPSSLINKFNNIGNDINMLNNNFQLNNNVGNTVIGNAIVMPSDNSFKSENK